MPKLVFKPVMGNHQFLSQSIWSWAELYNTLNRKTPSKSYVSFLP